MSPASSVMTGGTGNGRGSSAGAVNVCGGGAPMGGLKVKLGLNSGAFTLSVGLNSGAAALSFAFDSDGAICGPWDAEPTEGSGECPMNGALGGSGNPRLRPSVPQGGAAGAPNTKGFAKGLSSRRPLWDGFCECVGWKCSFDVCLECAFAGSCTDR